MADQITSYAGLCLLVEVGERFARTIKTFGPCKIFPYPGLSTIALSYYQCKIVVYD